MIVKPRTITTTVQFIDTDSFDGRASPFVGDTGIGITIVDNGPTG